MNQGRRIALLVLIALMAVATYFVTRRRESAVPSQPGDAVAVTGPINVVLITYCTVRADRLGAYGYELADTPNLDALAREGVVFESHYSQASYSGGSFATMVTGKYGCGHGVFDHPGTISECQATMGEMLKGAGYRTGAFLTHPFLYRKYGFARGFDEFSVRKEAVGIQAGNAVQWIRRQKDEPFFLWFQTDVPHFPYNVPKQLVRDRGKPLDLAINRHGELHGATSRSAGELMFDFDRFGYSEGQLESVLVAYDATVSYADRLTGRILDALKESGAWDRTLVIMTSDHGDCHGEHNIYFNHAANLYEPVIRVPLMIKFPGGAFGGLRPGEVTRHIDLLPTVAEAVGAAYGGSVDGEPLQQVIDGSSDRRVAFAESGVLRASRVGLPHYRQYVEGVAGKWRMVRDGRYKLICIPGSPDDSADTGCRYELYDLEADPAESRNLSDKLPAERERLAGLLARWFECYDSADTAPGERTEVEIEELRSLGYID
jgi:arylsulfatase A-like enzyme